MNVFDLSATLTLDSSQYEQGLRRAEGQAKSAGSGGGGFTVLKGAMANLVSGGINMVAGALTNNLGNAFARVDTMNNYGIVMKNLGHDSKDAEAQIQSLADGIDGLPTALDSITSVQQQFAALGGPLEDATDLTIALNNATLAGGQGQEIANSAMQQWYQMIASGKSDMQSMKIINMAMPAQMDAIAKSVIGADATWQDLHEEWKKNPEITQKVKDAILDLNKNGAEGMESFEQQSKDATKGIQTSMQNLQTAITKGMANFIKDTGLDKAIGEQLENVKTVINDAFSWATGFAEKVKDVGIVKAISDELDAINKMLSNFDFANNLDVAKAFDKMVQDVAKALPQILPKLGALINTFAEWFVNNGAEMIVSLGKGLIMGLPHVLSFMGDIINAILKVVIGLPMKLLAMGLGAIGNFALGILKGVNKVVTSAGKVVAKVVSAIAKLPARLLSLAIRSVASLAQGIAKGVGKAVSAVKRLGSRIVNGLKNGIKGVADIGGNIVKGIWNGISNGYKWITGKIKSWIGNVTKFFKKVLGIKSPSKVFADEVGQWIPRGIAKGIEDNSDAVEDALEDVVDIPEIAEFGMSDGTFADGMRMVQFAPNITVDGAENPESYAQRLMEEMKREVRAS